MYAYDLYFAFVQLTPIAIITLVVTGIVFLATSKEEKKRGKRLLIIAGIVLVVWILLIAIGKDWVDPRGPHPYKIV